jgi:multimeric flavodoxin WrbA
MAQRLFSAKTVNFFPYLLRAVRRNGGYYESIIVKRQSHENGCTYTALSEIAAQLNKNGIDCEIHWLGDKPINGCTGCGACFRNKNGKCVFGDKDGINELITKSNYADGVIFGGPVHYAGAAGNLHCALDRVFLR